AALALSLGFSAGCSGSAQVPAAAAPSAAPAAATPSGATSPDITAQDLRTRLFIVAADSMTGREVGTWGNFKAISYIASELERMGVEPAGEDGYFQELPMHTRTLVSSGSLTVGQRDFVAGEDWAPLPPLPQLGGLPVGSTGDIDGVPVVYGGDMADPSTFISAEQAAGKLVILAPPLDEDGNPTFGIAAPAIVAWSEAAGIAMANFDGLPRPFLGFFMAPQSFMSEEGPTDSRGALALFISLEMAETILGSPFADLEPGAIGTPVAGSFSFETTPPEVPTLNVIGIVRGSDPELRNQYVAIGAHSDHVGFSQNPVPHDSLRAFLEVVRPLGAESPNRAPTDEEAATVATVLEGLRALRPVDRPDSISNGADDDGSGTVTTLELAEAFASAPTKPRRSVLFVFHNGEEAGLLGSRYFTDHPTVPRDSIVAQLNMDMIGRGQTSDLSEAGPGYLQLIGSRRLSTELGDIVEAVNEAGDYGFEFDYQYDADGHPSNFYCRSDHAMYARYGIPIVFFSTGSHRDYHQVTDEPQYIEYDKMARIGNLIKAIADEVLNLDNRVEVDGPVPEDPNAPCRQ
ncbi:MAG: M28 family metallopeptidase, partial [Longimicrobiales bacterium]